MTGSPFDATLRRLLAIDPPAWLALLGLPASGPTRVVDSDVSTVTAAADGVYEVGEPARYLAHAEFQSGRDPSLARRLLHYNVLLHHRRDLPVRSVALLLRPAADLKALDGSYRVQLPGEEAYLDFRYEVVRLWTLDVAPLLEGGLGLLPLAPLANVAKSRQPAIVGRMKRRLDREVSSPEANDLWVATRILMGLRYPAEFVESVLKGVGAMEESTTYQEILKRGEVKGKIEGKIEGKRETLLRQGRKRFGQPGAATIAAIESIADVEEMERLLDRLLDVGSWADLLGPEAGGG